MLFGSAQILLLDLSLNTSNVQFVWTVYPHLEDTCRWALVHDCTNYTNDRPLATSLRKPAAKPCTLFQCLAVPGVQWVLDRVKVDGTMHALCCHRPGQDIWSYWNFLKSAGRVASLIPKDNSCFLIRFGIRALLLQNWSLESHLMLCNNLLNFVITNEFGSCVGHPNPTRWNM